MTFLRALIDPGLPLLDELELAVRAVLEGGQEILKRYRKSPEVWSGRTGGPVTAADVASNEKILDILLAAIPRDRIVSEEVEPHPYGSSGSGSGRLWLVDPLDGTKEFIAGNGEFSVMVGMADEGAALLGAVYAPAWDRLYVGIVGAGSWAIERPTCSPSVRILMIPDPREGLRKPPPRLRVIRSRSHPARALSRVPEIAGDVEWVQCGSVGLKCAHIAENEADLYLHPVPYLREWDTCAPEAILRAAGGRVTDCRGMDLDYGKTDSQQVHGIFAARPDIWNRLSSLVTEVILPELPKAKG